jgi:sugar phosphate isomerase/epimerase
VSNPAANLHLLFGVKSDPVEYRYSYEWLFTLLEEEGVHFVQLGAFSELFQLPDDYFLDLRRQAEAHGITIASIFTAHREMGGFLRDEHPAWEVVTRRRYERLIQVGALVGASHVGGSAGAVMRDHMHFKDAGIQRYLSHMKELMAYAATQGIACLTTEPMSCSAEPPSRPDEIQDMAGELMAFHRSRPATTARFGFCSDVAHGFLDAQESLLWDNYTLLKAALPYVRELHLKNTDARFDATFGFSDDERRRGIIDIESVRRFLLDHADLIPQPELIGYLEFPGPKWGRDYSDHLLENQFRQSLCYLKQAFRA